MRIHHLNCVSTCPLGGRLMDGRSPGLMQRGQLTCHCLLVETEQGLVLIDTGFGLNDVRDPGKRLSRFFLTLLDPDFREEHTAIRQIEKLGYSPRDVRHIILSHLDFDHAGGLDDFPHARVHLLQRESAAALAQTRWLDRQRYRPQQWRFRQNWQLYSAKEGSPWFGFQNVQPLAKLPPEILLVPMPGHTLGHAGIAIDQGGTWLLYAADAYFYFAEMNTKRPYCTPGLRFYQWMMEKDRSQRLANQARLRAVVRDHSDEVSIFCAHDLREFQCFSHHASLSSSLGGGLAQAGSDL